MTVKESVCESVVKKIPRLVKESVCESVVRRFLDLLL